MKKVLCLLMVLTMAFGCFTIGASAAEYGIVLNNNVALLVGNTSAVAHNTLCTLPVAPMEADGEIFVPLRAISELFNGIVSYDNATGVIDVSFGADKKLSMLADSEIYIFNGRAYTFGTTPRVVNDNTMVPLYAIAHDIIGKTVFYDQTTKVVIVSDRAVIKNAMTDAAVLSTIATAIATNNLPPITVPTSYELDWSIPEDSMISVVGGSDAPQIQTVMATPVSVSASQEPEIDNNGPKAFDGDIGTRWACDGDGEIVADFGSVVNIVNIKIAWWKWEERSAKYDLEISTDGANYTSVFSGSAVGQFYEEHAVNQQARYVKVKSHGNTSSNWNSLLECEVYIPGTASSNNGGATTGKIASATGSKVSLNGGMVTASAEPESQNPGRNIADGDSNSVWAADGSANATVDLGSVMPVSSVGVQMKVYDDGRAIKFGISTSEDGTAYTTAYDGQSVEGGGDMEYIGVGKSARFVRISVSGSTIGSWASVAEVEVYTGEGGGAAATSSYPNKSSVSGEFIIAPVGSASVLTVEGDNTTLGVKNNTKDSKQVWSLEGNALKNKGTGLCADVFEMSYDEGGQIGVWEGNGGDNQSWSFELEGDGYYIKSNMSGLYLTANGSNIQQRSKGSATKWVVADVNATPVTSGGAGTVISGEFKINVFGTSDALTVESDNLTLSVKSSSRSSNQLWTKSSNSFGDVFTNVGASLCMDVSGQSMEEGGAIIVWEGNDGNNQSWALEQEGEGYYIRSVMSGLYLANVDGNVQQVSKSNATKWEIVGDEVKIVSNIDPKTPVAINKAIDGRFKMVIYGTNNAITVGRDGASVQIERFADSNNQIWTMGEAEVGFTIVNSADEAYLDINKKSPDEFIKACVAVGDDAPSQAWVLEKVGNYYYIKNANSGFYLSYDGTSIRQKSFAFATKWALRNVD